MILKRRDIMRRKKRIFTFVLTAFAMLAISIGVNAAEKQTESEKTVEYDNFEDVLTEGQTEAGDILYLSSVERDGDVWKALYQDEETLQETIKARSAESPLMFITVTREFTKTYTSYEAIPTSFYYEGFDSELNTWVWGTLYLQSTKKIDYGWEATFKGTLQGQI